MFSPRAANARGGAMTPRTAAKARHTLPLSSPLLDSTSRRVAAITPKGVELYGQSNVRLDSVESFRPLEGSSGLQSWANIMNVYIGMGLLSIPYALSLCGWSGLLALATVLSVCLYTGKIIVRAFGSASGASTDLMSPHDAGSCSYPGVGHAAFGAWGEASVVLFMFLECFGGLAMCIIFMWTNLFHLIPAEWDHFTVALITVAAVLPTVWVKRFSELSFISLLGFGSSMVITVLVVSVFVYDDDEHRAAVKADVSSIFFTDINHFGMGVGIFVTSLGGQVCLPTLYDQMMDKSAYQKVLHASFLTMTAVYCLMAVAGFLRYGVLTDVLITSNLATNPGGIVAQAAVGLVVASCGCTVAPLVAVLSGIPEGKLGITNSWAVCGSRTSVLVAAATVAWVARNNLGNVESLIGGIGSLMTSLVLPCVFYLKLCSMPTWERVVNVAIVVCAVCLGTFIVTTNLRAML